ncbi:Ig-like domain-containing protein [Paenibacillus aceti]|uniref:BIG2 domain-containing protein n=1 Tax=Paenibacillus aceti TaxID=1820010 RepID=A0ABQ1VPB8_9BACL|nr:Ig-like domain-containing protein [Paenibacillus aceti]GGF86397.1 hypothetical protein GCM10010913_04840 [Paenibacillus aceti]
MINLFDIDNESNFQFMLDNVGRSVTVNNSPTPIKATITNTSTNLNTDYDDRKISTIETLQRGDLIDYNGNKYMVISEVNDKRYGHYKGLIRPLPHEITFSHKCVFESAFAYIENSNPSFKNGTVLTLIQDKIVVYLPIHTMELSVISGDEFMIQGNKFKIVTNDTFTQPGIAILTCERTQINPALDDVEHNIANGKACPINVTNSNPISVFVGSTFQLNWTSTNNAPVTFTTSDAFVATVDGLGVVSGLADGNVTITVTNASNGFIYDTVDISVEDIPEVKTIVITSSKPNNKTDDYFYITINTSVTFTGTIYDGDVSTSNAVTFQVFADDKTSTVSTTKYTSAISGNAITITAKSDMFYMQLLTTSVDDPRISTWQRIRIKGLY